MSRLLRIIAIAVAWLVLAPLAALVPSAGSAAASETEAGTAWLTDTSWAGKANDRDGDQSFAFGKRVTSTDGDRAEIREVTEDFGPPSPLSNSAYAMATFAASSGFNAAANGFAASSGGMAMSSFANSMMRPSELPNFFRLPEPDFEIWPARDELQIVELETFLYLDKEWDDHFNWLYLYYYWHTADFEPIATQWYFEEQATGKTSSEYCLGRGMRWVYGLKNTYCGHDWEHSSDVTGPVTIHARIWYWLDFNSSYGSYSGPYPGQLSDPADLMVGEVQAYGKTIAAPVKGNPDRGGESGESGSGVCSVWGISVICKVGKKVLKELIERVPFLKEIVDFVEGCIDAIGDAAGELVEILKEIRDAVTNPKKFIDEKVGLIKEVVAAAKEDPEGFIKEFGIEFFRSLLELDTLEEEGTVEWIGKMVCKLAIMYFTGKLAASVVTKLRKWIKKKKDGNDGPGNPCRRTSSFPAETPVLMADGSYTAIEDVRPGDMVLSHNPDTLVWEPKAVVDQWSHIDRGAPATVTLADDSTITATDDHLFWVENTQTWTQLQHVRPGDDLRTPDGTVTADNVTVGPQHRWTVWELTVADNHNFAVSSGEVDVLVHNCDDGTEGKQSKDNNPKAFKKGKLKEHYDKHGDEFGPPKITQNEYLKRAKEFAKRVGAGIKERRVGNFIIKYDPKTNELLVIHAKSREIRTFYKPDGRDADPFEAAIKRAEEIGAGRQPDEW